MDLEIKVDATAALARFSPAGIPEGVRNQLRMTIPDLIKEVAKDVDTNLGELQSRTRLATVPTMIENANGLTGQLEVAWTGEQEKDFIPQILESGARAHVIEAVNAKALAFTWGGAQVFFKKVNHPGFPGIRYMQRAWDANKDNIRTQLEIAINKGLQE